MLHCADPRFRQALQALTAARAVLTSPALASDVPTRFALALGEAGHVTGHFAVPHSQFLRQLRAARG